VRQPSQKHLQPVLDLGVANRVLLDLLGSESHGLRTVKALSVRKDLQELARHSQPWPGTLSFQGRGGENSAAVATSNSRFDVASTFSARVIRFSIAQWVLTNALATWPTLNPHKVCRTSATCASSGNRGWQQENIMRSRSSLIAFAAKSSSTRGASVHSLWSARIRPRARPTTQEDRKTNLRYALFFLFVAVLLIVARQPGKGRVYREPAINFYAQLTVRSVYPTGLRRSRSRGLPTRVRWVRLAFRLSNRPSKSAPAQSITFNLPSTFRDLIINCFDL
jgi:hypothetical protein